MAKGPFEDFCVDLFLLAFLSCFPLMFSSFCGVNCSLFNVCKRSFLVNEPADGIDATEQTEQTGIAVHWEVSNVTRATLMMK